MWNDSTGHLPLRGRARAGGSANGVGNGQLLARLVALRGDRGRESALTLHSDHNDWTCLAALVPTGLLVTGEEIDTVEDVADLKERRHRSQRPVLLSRRRASRPRTASDAGREFDRHGRERKRGVEGQ